MLKATLTVIDCGLYALLSFIVSELCLMSIPKLHHISLGLVYLHSQKIVHGDLKAVNIIQLLFISAVSDGSVVAQCTD